MERLLLLAMLLLPTGFWGQTSFLRMGQVFAALPGELAEFSISPIYQTLDAVPIGAVPTGTIEAIGFRKADNLLYGIRASDNHLLKIGQNAEWQDLGDVGLGNVFFYLAGDVSPDGKFLFVVASDADAKDMRLVKIELESGSFATQGLNLSGGIGHLADIAFDPFSGTLYGFDKIKHCFVTINPGNGLVVPFPPISFQNEVYGIYFDAFGDLYAVGTAVYGIVSGHFSIDKNTGEEEMLATGPVFPISDLASCPFSVGLKCLATPEIILPCGELTLQYTLANGSEETLTDVSFEHPLPAGFHLAGVLQNTFGALVDTLSIPGSLFMKGISLTPGTRTLRVKLLSDDLPKGKYRSQAKAQNLPALYGGQVHSDNPASPGFGDSSSVVINRFEEDTLSFYWFVCHGESLILDATEYGGELHWSTGSSNSQIAVTQGAMYSLKAGNICESIVVNHDVTSASCPYTISVSQVFVPDTTFACSEMTMRFVLDNDSAEPRHQLSLTDTLPVGFAVVEILKNPFGGILSVDSSTNSFTVSDLHLPVGEDTLDLLLQIGDIPPGRYRNRAKLFDLPQVMGPVRLSNDPATFAFDSTTVVVQGALSDTMFMQEKICPHAELLLDASALGITFLWDDGSTEPNILISEAGQYHLKLFDGCEPADVFWMVGEADFIEILPLEPIQIHLGEEILLSPQVLNQGDSLWVAWNDPFENSLSCLDCLSPKAFPFETVVYSLLVSNGECSDSTSIHVEVDVTRRIFAPNIFSPNDDGVNDYFFLQSPDEAILQSFQIFDRWGNQVFQAAQGSFSDAANRWDGFFRGRKMEPGVYFWQAMLVFPDKRQELFSGDVTLIR